MLPFPLTTAESKLIQRLRALQSAGFDRVRIQLRPLAILEKTDARVELIERSAAPAPATPATASGV